MITDTHEWWALLRGVSLFNLLAWLTAAWLLHRRGMHEPGLWPLRRLQLLLSAGYVAGCAYRSLLPVYDVQRLVLVDSWWSSVIVGRSVATFAELCFVAQWALLLHEVSRDAGSTAGRRVACVLLPMIAVAEMFSWYSVLTTSNIGHVVEESLWGLGAALLVLSLAGLWPRVSGVHRPLLVFWGTAGALYAIYMFGVDVPMYWSRWVADEAQGRAYLSVAQGVVDASTRWVVSYRWDDWKTEVTWMSLYFSVAVWLSIALMHAPRVSMRSANPRSRRSLASAWRSRLWTS